MSEVTESATLQNLNIIRADLANGAPSYDSLERLKYVEKYIQQLSDERVALKAENETAVKNMAALQSELAAFKNWQPSDPGTKEAMECAGSSWEYKSADIARIAVSLGVLATSYCAAMVRLEEAEKQLGSDAKLERQIAIEYELVTHMSELLDEQQRICATHDKSKWPGLIRIAEEQQERAEAAESQVAALTASLASMTKERDCFKHALAVEIKGDHAGECDCLDHRRAAEKLLSDFKSFDSYIGNFYIVDQYKRRAESAEASLAELRKRMGEAEKIVECVRREAQFGVGGGRCWLALIDTLTDYDRSLASPPSPAPVESKPKECCKKIRTAFGNAWECARPSGHRGECGLKVMPDDDPAADSAKQSPEGSK